MARLYAAPHFRKSLAAQFSSSKRLSVWLAPPLISRTDPATGRPRKRRFGPWIFTAFAGLARLKGLRGTAFDPFGHSEERRAERGLVSDYLALADSLSAGLTAQKLTLAIALASAPLEIRGFGPVKAEAAKAAKARMDQMQAEFSGAGLPTLDAAA